VLKTIFTWWNGGSFGALFHINRRGVKVGSDNYGNTYYEARDDRDSYDKGRKRRWVIYSGYADASKVPPEWHGWLHYTFDDLPSEETLPTQVWETEYSPNLTGTMNAWRPKGSISRTGSRPHATGDYQPWTPD
jgi:NADH:ubiquinone oxidoreductase subunit